jgi:hypothetical protein
MALVTGRDCDLTIGTKAYAGVVSSFALDFDSESLEYATLGGTLAGAGSETGTLTITFAYDSGDTPNSLFDDLWTAAAAGQKVAYVAKVGKSTFSGNAIAKRPSAQADAENPSETVVEMTLDGMPTKAAASTLAAPAPAAK